MHKSSMLRMKWFKDTFLNNLNPEQELKVLDLGSQRVENHSTYKVFFYTKPFHYIGMDMVGGDNVDIVLKNPYSWKEVPDNFADVLISGQCFEHIEFPWLTMAEIGRVLKPNGLCCIIAPSLFPLHRYPVNTYNYFSDGMIALAKYTGFEILHCSTNRAPYNESKDFYVGRAQDTIMVAKKPSNWRPNSFDIDSYTLVPADLEKLSTGMIPQEKQPYFSEKKNDELPKNVEIYKSPSISDDSVLGINHQVYSQLSKVYFQQDISHFHMEFGWPLFDRGGYFQKNQHRIDAIMHILADEMSKIIYKGMIKLRQTENAQHFPVHIIEEQQYFIDKLVFGENEVYIDCGASGHTIDDFIAHCPNYQQIVAFEPKDIRFEDLYKRHGNNPKITIYNCGVFVSDGETTFLNTNEKGNLTMKSKAIDNLGLEKVSFIKMDVEGAEMPALKGASKTIQRDKPKMAICIYHSCEDMVNIPEYIHQLRPDYKLYIRQYHHFGDTVLYAIP